MQMGMHQRIKIAIPCHDCGQTEGHAEDCIGQRLRRLLRKQRHLKCPKCRAKEVDLNVMDNWECRACHTQFTSGNADSTKRRVVTLVDDREGTVHLVYQLVTPGKGTFPLDPVVAVIRQEMKERRKRR